MANRYPYQRASFQPRAGGMGMPPVAMGLTTQQPGVDMSNVRFPGLVTGMWNPQGHVQSWIPPQQQRPSWEHQQKEREYLKQQQKLRAMSYSNKKSPVTADALIENLLGQKETFVLKKNEDAPNEKQITTPDGTLTNGSTKSSIPDRKSTAPHHSSTHQRISSTKDSIAVNTRCEEKEKPTPVVGSVPPGTGLPHWASGGSGMNLPPMYERIWEAVACPLGSGLADTSLLFPLLLTSGLPREVLGHIWALTNRTVPGRLTRPELNVTLALIALAQNGHSFASIPLEALPHPLVPNLDLSTLTAAKRVAEEAPVSSAPLSSISASSVPRPVAPVVPATNRADLNAPVSSSYTTPPVSTQGNPKSVLDDDWDEFTDFQSASSSIVSNSAISSSSMKTFSDSSTKSTSSNTFTSSVSKSEKPSLLDSDLQTPILPCIPLSVPSQGNRLLSAESSPVLSSRSTGDGRGIGSRLANHTLGAPKPINQGSSSKTQLNQSKEDDFDDFCEFKSGPSPSNNFENSSLNKSSSLENSTFDELFPRCVVRPSFKPEPLRESAIRSEPTSSDMPTLQKSKKESENRADSLNSVQTWMSSSDFLSSSPTVPKTEVGDEKPGDFTSLAKPVITPVMSMEKDRYSALRELAAEISPTKDAPSKEEEEDDDDEDDDFGDFLSARGTPAAAASEDSFSEIAREGTLSKEGSKDLIDDPFNILSNIPNEPQPVNSTDWSADFSAFEEQPTTREINNNDATPNSDDEFGDFVGGGREDVMASLRIDGSWQGGDRRDEGSIGTGEASPDSRSINAVAVGEGNGSGRARTGSLPSLDLKGFSVTGGGEGEGSSGEEGDGIASADGRRNFCSSMSGEKFSLDSWDSIKSADRHTYEWRRCLASCLSLLQSALLIFSSISSGEVIEEVVSTEEGEDYLSNLLEVYWVSRRIAASYQHLDRRDSQLDTLLDDIGAVWEGLMPFYEKSGIMEMEDSTGLRGTEGGRKGEGSSFCSICLASIPGDVDGELSQGLSYGGHIYHNTCANLWVNCVDRLLPSLPLLPSAL
ncbi:hypothetical protein J437_LFUL011612 [Ladona fulva]|uniref:EH domain-containing protein n=1 Tax=Ladona fulva TaxID=123851 RepID=A0A8K0KBM3_LADFU|nr:hypothetical protein J437_LFUL011612 [Ladona fulva]